MMDQTAKHALFASKVYERLEVGQLVGDPREGYTVSDVYNNPYSGFQAAAFENRDRSETIIAYRGTEAIADGMADLGMVAARLNLQAGESKGFTAEIVSRTRAYARDRGIDSHIEVTGHSLGGTLAQINAAEFGLNGETFNAYGSADLRGMPKTTSGHVINHVRAGDPVSAASHHYGEVRIYATSDDIQNLRTAGYENGHGLGHALRATSLESHAMANFLPDGRALPDMASAALYERNKSMIDEYRADILTSNTALNVALNHPQSLAVIPETVAASIYVEHLKYEANVIGHAVSAAVTRGHDVNTAMHASAFSSSSMRGSWDALPQPDHPAIARLDDPSHPGNTLFKQALEGTQRLDAAQGREPDKLSTNLAGSLAVESQRKGMDRIDHVVLSDDASRAYAVQGELSSPFKKIAEVQTELGISASIDQSSKAWPQATEQRQQDAMTQSMERASQVAPEMTQPTVGRTLH